MGYRSDVAIALKREDWIRLRCEVVENGYFNSQEEFDWFLPKVREENDCVVLHGTAIKWYDFAYDDIKFIANFLKDIEHQFLRIGEEAGDVEEDNTFENGEFFFMPNTTITFDV